MQYENARGDTEDTAAGMSIEANDVHLANTSSSIASNADGSCTEDSLSHSQNAWNLSFVTLLGTSADTNPVFLNTY